jgi:6,7-dimethyl-8-ribityllumazine synthase
MGNTFRGKCVADGIRVAIVSASFNELVVNQLVEGAEDALERFSMSDCDVDVYWVPGCFEIPQTVSTLLDQAQYDGILALGCLIKGETDHYHFLAEEVTRGLGSLSTISPIPICYGILTCDNLEQALHRAGSKSGNKGAESMQALIEMINLSAVIGPEQIGDEDVEDLDELNDADEL